LCSSYEKALSALELQEAQLARLGRLLTLFETVLEKSTAIINARPPSKDELPHLEAVVAQIQTYFAMRAADREHAAAP
jgi:hypothetical protein